MSIRPALLVLIVAAASVTAGSSCKNKSTTKSSANCTPALQRTAQYFGALCAAYGTGIVQPNAALARIKLARGPLPPVRALPDAPLVIVGSGWLVLDRQVVPSWNKLWRDPAGAAAGAPADAGIIKKLNEVVGSKKKHLLLAIAADTPAAQVVTLLDLIGQANYNRVSFLVTPNNAPRFPADPLSKPGMPTADPLVGRPWKEPTTTVIGRVARPWITKGCQQVNEVLIDLHRAGRVTNCAATATRLQKGLERCGCPLDERPLLALIRRFVPPIMFVALHTVTLNKTATAVKITDGAQPWDLLLARVLKMDRSAFRLTGFAVRSGGSRDSGSAPADRLRPKPKSP